MVLNEAEWLKFYEEFENGPDTRMIAPPNTGAPKVNPQLNTARGWRVWEGYLEAAGILIAKAIECESLADRLIFPALFNLRHAMEVALKWHIAYAGGVVPKRAGHDLLVLIESFRSTAEDLDDDDNYLPEYVLICAAELALLDPKAVAFRYPSEASDELMQNAPGTWSLARLAYAIETISICLDGLDGKIDLSRCEEYQAYLRSH